MAIERSGVAITADLIKTKLLQEVKSSDNTALFVKNRQSVNKKGPMLHM